MTAHPHTGLLDEITLTPRNRYYPDMPPRLGDETDSAYTDRLTGADGGNPPYDHRRNRQCSIGWHSECSQKIKGSTIGATGACQCPHPTDPRLIAALPHVATFAAMVSTPDVTLSVSHVTRLAVDVVIDTLAAIDAVEKRGIVAK